MLRIPRNPFMSLWLSAANRMANTGRGMMMAEARRQQTEIAAAATRRVEHFWTRTLRGTTRSHRPKDR
jgi:hypothetical protein